MSKFVKQDIRTTNKISCLFWVESCRTINTATGLRDIFFHFVISWRKFNRYGYVSMRKNSKSKTKKRVTFITKNNERREISLSSGYSDSLFGEFKELVKLLSYVERFGTRLSERDAKRVESLPTALRKKTH
jgi:hypothetical protein